MIFLQERTNSERLMEKQKCIQILAQTCNNIQSRVMRNMMCIMRRQNLCSKQPSLPVIIATCLDINFCRQVGIEKCSRLKLLEIVKSSLFKKLRSSTHFRSILSPRPARDRVDDRSIVNIEAASNNKWPATRLRRFRSILKMPVINNTVSALLGIKCIQANESGRKRATCLAGGVEANHHPTCTSLAFPFASRNYFE